MNRKIQVGLVAVGFIAAAAYLAHAGVATSEDFVATGKVAWLGTSDVMVIVDKSGDSSGMAKAIFEQLDPKSQEMGEWPLDEIQTLEPNASVKDEYSYHADMRSTPLVHCYKKEGKDKKADYACEISRISKVWATRSGGK